MIRKTQLQKLRQALAEVSVTALTGPREAGKTTLAQAVADCGDATVPPLYLDLDSPADRARLSDPTPYLQANAHRLVILDEIQRLPDLPSTVLELVETGDRKAGRFLMIGPASVVRMLPSGGDMAHLVRPLELAPISAAEIAPDECDRLWLRGGFPDSLLASSDAASLRWRDDWIRRHRERDIPHLGTRTSAETLPRFLTMLAHRHASLLNQAELARALGVDGKTVAAWLDLMVDQRLVRRLPPWRGPSAKRLVKSPKVGFRDSGLVHALLGIETLDALLGHPIAGSSWEGLVVESLLAAAPDGTQASFYRTAVGAEIDLVLTIPGKGTWAIEITRRRTPKLDRGFHHACEDVQPDAGFVVHPGPDRQAMPGGVEALPLPRLVERLRQSA